MTESYYDSDDALNASPRLQPVKPNYRSEETPPPFIHEKSSSSSPATERGDNDELPNEVTQTASSELRKRSKKRRKKSRVRPSQGDTVLISYLAPNNPDIAQQAGKQALDYRSDGESSEVGTLDEDSDRRDMPSAKQEYPEDATVTAQAALQFMDSSSETEPPTVTKIEVEPDSRLHDKVAKSTNDDEDDLEKSPPKDNPKTDPAPFRRASPINTDAWKSAKSKDEDTLATSPNLAKFRIKESDAPDGSTLPALQKSPPRTTLAHSGDHTQNLPSLQTALNHLSEQEGVNSATPAYHALPAQSPTSMTRPPPFVAQHPGPSPSSYSQPSPASSKDNHIMSPPSHPNQPSHPLYWRPNQKTDPPYSGDSTTPSTSTLTGESPSSAYPTPSVQDHRTGTEEDSPQLINGPLPPNGPFTSTAFKCSHPGCNAPPFQTQYLLNSHANVHSETRPHYCPVNGCPRSYGGKGFKRKNEMIRHGLVHDSPGYVCPFCPDQQHKYPRPDNLQRHVRVHHVDKDRDDPELRQVLSQRPEGGNRGRRRRHGLP